MIVLKFKTLLNIRTHMRNLPKNDPPISIIIATTMATNIEQCYSIKRFKVCWHALFVSVVSQCQLSENS